MIEYEERRERGRKRVEERLSDPGSVRITCVRRIVAAAGIEAGNTAHSLDYFK